MRRPTSQKTGKEKRMKFTNFAAVKLFTVMFAVVVTAFMLTACGKSGGDVSTDAPYLSKDIEEYTDSDWQDLANNAIQIMEQSIKLMKKHGLGVDNSPEGQKLEEQMDAVKFSQAPREAGWMGWDRLTPQQQKRITDLHTEAEKTIMELYLQGH